MSTLSLNVALERPGFTLARRSARSRSPASRRCSARAARARRRCCASSRGSSRKRAARSLSTARPGRATARACRAPARHRLRVPGRPLVPASHRRAEPALRAAARSAAQPASAIDFARQSSTRSTSRRCSPRRTPSLSGGEQQRVAIARALLTSPRLHAHGRAAVVARRARARARSCRTSRSCRRPSACPCSTSPTTSTRSRASRTTSCCLPAGEIVAHGNVAAIFERIDLGAFTGGLEAGVGAARRKSRPTTTASRRCASARSSCACRWRLPRRQHAPASAFTRATWPSRRCARRSSASATCSPRASCAIEPGASLNVELLLDVDGEHLRARITRDALDELELCRRAASVRVDQERGARELARRLGLDMNVTNLDSVVFGVTDLAACRRFWTDFGLAESTAADGATVFSCQERLDGRAARRRRPDVAATDRARRHAARSDLRREVRGRSRSAIAAELERDRPVRVDADGTRARRRSARIRHRLSASHGASPSRRPSSSSTRRAGPIASTRAGSFSRRPRRSR